MRLGEPDIFGSLDRALIDTVIKRHTNQIRYCYQRELVKDPTLSGQIVVKFVVSPQGDVTNSNIMSSSMDSSEVEACVAGRFKRFFFFEPRGGGIVIVNYPFLFFDRVNAFFCGLETVRGQTVLRSGSGSLETTLRS